MLRPNPLVPGTDPAGWCPFGDDTTTEGQVPETQVVNCQARPALLDGSNNPLPDYFRVKFRCVVLA